MKFNALHAHRDDRLLAEAGFPDLDTSGRSFSRLMVADDTGSAIKGQARGDIFVGSGNEAGVIAGDVRSKAEFTLLVPNANAPGTGVVTD